MRLTRVQPPQELEAGATGELEGTGRWARTSADGGTLVRYYWDIRNTQWRMSVLAPVARPVFSWNHDQLMREVARAWFAALAQAWHRQMPTSRPHQPVPPTR
jgi:hypothetical protein